MALSLTSNNIIFFIFTATLCVYISYTIPKLQTTNKQTNLVFYIHDYLAGDDATTASVAGKLGAGSSILQFGTILAIDDRVTEGPTIDSRAIGRAQGMYMNSQLDGKAVYMMFSVAFTQGKYEGSTIEIQGFNPYTTRDREFGVVSGTGYFRFVKGYGILQTESTANFRTVFKLNVTVKHY